jgi:hypothetical protein
MSTSPSRVLLLDAIHGVGNFCECLHHRIACVLLVYTQSESFPNFTLIALRRALLERLAEHSDVLDTVYSVWSSVRFARVLLATTHGYRWQEEACTPVYEITESTTYS